MEKFRIYLQMKDDKSAFREIEGLVKEYPMDMRYQVILGDVYMQNGKQQEAYDIYQKVLASEPDNVMARFSLASYYEQTGQKDLYRQQIDSLLLNKKVPADTKLNVMRQIIAQNEQAEADSTDVISLFDRILQQDTEDDQIPMLYSQYLWAKNLKEASVPVLERVVQIDPTNKAARLMLLEIAVQKSDFDQVIKICEPGIEATRLSSIFIWPLPITRRSVMMRRLPSAGKLWRMLHRTVKKRSCLISILSWVIFIIPKSRWQMHTMHTIPRWFTIRPI